MHAPIPRDFRLSTMVEALRAFFKDNTWTKGSNARTENDADTLPEAADATQWCMQGALIKLGFSSDDIGYFSVSCEKAGFASTVHMNDSCSDFDTLSKRLTLMLKDRDNVS